MTVILCHPSDLTALWLGRSMQRLGVDAEVVTIEQIVYSRRIVFRMTNTGDAGSVELANGRLLRPESIDGLINRVRYLPVQHFERADLQERAYAESELSAFVLGWINGVAGRVINPPLPFDLGGGTFPRPTLVHLAAMAGLHTNGLRANSDEADSETESPASTHAVIVFDGRVFGPLLPRALQEACRRFAALVGAPLLQVEWCQAKEEPWHFVGASGMADFRIGGQPLVKALMRTMGTRKAA